MSRSINTCIIAGHLTGDVAVRVSQEGKKFAHFGVAVNRRPSKNLPNPGTDFIDVTVIGNDAEYAEKYLKKGSPFYGIGHFRSGSFTASDGNKRYTNEVIIDGSTIMWQNLSINMNHCLMMGRISSDIDYRENQTEPGKSYCQFNIAMDRDVRADENGNRPADFIRVKCFGYWASFVNKHFEKGSLIHVTGRIDTSPFTKTDGTKGYGFSIIPEIVDFAEKKKATSQEQAQNHIQGEQYQNAPQNQHPGYAPQGQIQDNAQAGQFQAPPQNPQNAPQGQFQNQVPNGQHQAPPQDPFQNSPFGNPNDFNNFGGDMFAGFDGSLDGDLPFQ